MTPPGKIRCIGGTHTGADRFSQLVTQRFPLAAAKNPQVFLDRVKPWASRATYERWLAAYRANDGSFLQHAAWGADRDLGDSHFLYGAMDDRFASNAARVFVPGGLDASAHVVSKKVCVVGAWDGTECLLLRALGAASVDAMDEVPVFCDMAQAQYDAWEIPGSVLRMSLYEIGVKHRWQSYDLVYVPGVMYHLTDIVTASVLLWSMLRPGGTLAIESIADPKGQRGARYLGASLPGWNWWSATPECYESVLRDCGFPDARTVEHDKGRGWWVGTRGVNLPAMSAGAAGFSRPDVLRAISELVANQNRK